MVKVFKNLKEQVLSTKEVVFSKRESINIKRKELEAEINRWGKEQKRKRLH